MRFVNNRLYKQESLLCVVRNPRFNYTNFAGNTLVNGAVVNPKFRWDQVVRC